MSKNTKRRQRSALDGKGIEGLIFDENSSTVVGWNEWTLRFRPIPDERGCTERDSVPNGVSPNCVWTEEFMGQDEGFAIFNGTGGDMGAYVTEVPVPDGFRIMVWDEPSWTASEVRRIGKLIRKWQKQFGVVEDEVAYEDFFEWCLEIDQDLEDILTWGFDPLIEKHFPGLENVSDLDACTIVGSSSPAKPSAKGANGGADNG